MDNSLASWASRRDEAVIAGRFVDLGPWYVGFGIVRSMRKSEVLAIRLALSHEGDLETKRDNLHELIYPAVLHNEDLVMTALEPMIIAFADAVDRDMIDMEEIAANLVSFIDDL